MCMHCIQVHFVKDYRAKSRRAEDTLEYWTGQECLPEEVMPLHNLSYMSTVDAHLHEQRMHSYTISVDAHLHDQC
jgi:hypothetical protein